MEVKEVRRPAEKKGRTRALLLLSGGLDSILAGKVLEEQGVEIVGLTFKSLFFGPKEGIRAAEEQGWPLVVIDLTEEEIQIVEKPKYGYGKNLNPCIDCHGQMVRIAGQLLEKYQADFVATGEVLGERPKSQNRQALVIVEKLSGLKRLVLRPLSARLLPVTIPEENRLVDREKLLDITGRSRKRQMELAEKYGIKEYPTPAGGCLLTDPSFSQRLKKLLEWRGNLAVQDISLIKLGRLFFEEEGLMVIGRNEQENEELRKIILPDDVVITNASFRGPLTVVRLKYQIPNIKIISNHYQLNVLGDRCDLRLEAKENKVGEKAEKISNLEESTEGTRQDIEFGSVKEEEFSGPKKRKLKMNSLTPIAQLSVIQKAALLTIRYSRDRLAEQAEVIISSGVFKERLKFCQKEWKKYL